MATLTRKEGISLATRGFILLLIITLFEVAIALVGNGHIIDGVHFPKYIMIPVMCILSLYKAYYIMKEFMHLGHETRSMAASVVLPTTLLIWAIIAFLWEGGTWGNRRSDVKERDSSSSIKEEAPKTGSILKLDEELSRDIHFMG